MRGELGWREGAGQEGGYGQSVTPKCDVSVREAAFSQVRCRCTVGGGGLGSGYCPVFIRDAWASRVVNAVVIPRLA